MISRNDVLADAVIKCFQECYKLAYPEISWEDFVELNKNHKEGEPIPCDFYYLPTDILKEVIDNIEYAYRIPPELKDNIEVLIDYCRDNDIVSKIGEENFRTVCKLLHDAGDIFKWDSDLNTFRNTVYLGAVPSCNKDKVIENWKKYRNKDIEIDDSLWNL